jgi:hypothetical protein
LAELHAHLPERHLLCVSPLQCAVASNGSTGTCHQRSHATQPDGHADRVIHNTTVSTDVPRSYTALTNGDGSLVSVPLSGVQTLRLTAGTNVISDTYRGLKEDFFMLVPLAQQPKLTVSLSAGLVTVSFPTQTGFNYTVQYKNLLTDPTWQSILPSVIGDGRVKSVSQPAGQPSRFYRLSVQ